MWLFFQSSGGRRCTSNLSPQAIHPSGSLALPQHGIQYCPHELSESVSISWSRSLNSLFYLWLSIKHHAYRLAGSTMPTPPPPSPKVTINTICYDCNNNHCQGRRESMFLPHQCHNSNGDSHNYCHNCNNNNDHHDCDCHHDNHRNGNRHPDNCNYTATMAITTSTAMMIIAIATTATTTIAITTAMPTIVITTALTMPIAVPSHTYV